MTAVSGKLQRAQHQDGNGDVYETEEACGLQLGGRGESGLTKVRTGPLGHAVFKESKLRQIQLSNFDGASKKQNKTLGLELKIPSVVRTQLHSSSCWVVLSALCNVSFCFRACYYTF